jgi:erythronate-4-phosphate dehydrogenase
MKIVMDENIPFGPELFSRIGDVRTLPGRGIKPSDLKDVDALLVRSVTRVDEELLSGSPVKFVGTATIGDDHIDKEYLHRSRIGFSTARGCNANSVSEWVVCSILHAADILGIRTRDLTLGIVGVGNVGRRVFEKARALGMNVLLNDPPRADAEAAHRGLPLREDETQEFVGLDPVLERADIVTLHVPLTREGVHATHRLIGAEQLRKMKASAVIINSSRGPVVEEEALRLALSGGVIRAAMLDVWVNEPDISPSTLERVLIGTPHIAGYSLDGKANGTRMVYEACIRFFGMHPEGQKLRLPPPAVREMTLDFAEDETGDESVRRVLSAAYPILRDDARLRAQFRLFPPDQTGVRFDWLRKTYPVRREWHSIRLKIGKDSMHPSAAVLGGLGFRVKTGS